MDLDRVFDLLDASAKAYPMKALADEIGKGESTLRNELTEQPGYKLGLRTAILIMRRTQDLGALDGLESMFNRVAFAIPTTDRTDMLPLLLLAGRSMHEFGEHTARLAGAMEDGRVTEPEAEACLKELGDVLKALIELKAHLERYL